MKGLKDTIKDPAAAVESVLKRNDATKKDGENYTAWIKKDAIIKGDVTWIVDQFAKSPVYA